MAHSDGSVLLSSEEECGENRGGPPRFRSSSRRVAMVSFALIGIVGAVLILNRGTQATNAPDMDMLSDFFFGAPPPPAEVWPPTGKPCTSTNKADCVTLCANKDRYGIGGNFMKFNAQKLTNAQNFGPGGKFSAKIKYIDIPTKRLTKANVKEQKCDIVQIGIGEADAGNRYPPAGMSLDQIKGLKEWSEESKHHSLVGAQGYSKVWESGYGVNRGASNPMSVTDLGKHVMSGPFGVTGNFNQGGSWKGNFDGLPAPEKYCVLVKTSTGKPTILIDKNSGSIFFSDVDQISQLGGVTNSQSCTGSNNDILFCNLYTFLATIVKDGPDDVCNYAESITQAGESPSKKPAPAPAPESAPSPSTGAKSPAPSPKPSCGNALTAQRFSCAAGLSLDAFCAAAPCASGCPQKPAPAPTPVPPPPPPCDPSKPTWFCQRDPRKKAKSFYPTCNEVNYERICCIPEKAYLSGSKYQYSNCGKSRCKKGTKVGAKGGRVDKSKCPDPPPPFRKCADEQKCIEEAEGRKKNFKGDVECKGKLCHK